MAVKLLVMSSKQRNGFQMIYSLCARVSAMKGNLERSIRWVRNYHGT